MKPWSTLEAARAPDGAWLTLQQRGTEFCIRADGQVLMGSRATGSEEALADAIRPDLRSGAQVLIGGLGMGFTLRAVLKRCPAAHLLVAELVPEVVSWNRRFLGHLAGHPLDDDRVKVVISDVQTVWRTAANLDAILLDVDNGPAALTRAANASLYRRAALTEAHAALGAQGVLAVWSAGPAPGFLEQLQQVGFHVGHRLLPSSRHHLLIGWKGRAEGGTWSRTPSEIKEPAREPDQPRAPHHRRRRR